MSSPRLGADALGGLNHGSNLALQCFIEHRQGELVVQKLVGEFTRFTSNDLGLNLDIDRWSVGPALQLGFDVSLNDKWSLSVDAKRAWISTDVSLSGTKLTTVGVDPWILGVGVGYRFGK